MFAVYNCLVTQHDLPMVGLAIAICVLASLAAISLFSHARNIHGARRLMWIAVAATASGIGIWATHFIAMLAFSPGIPHGYDLGLTIVSLVIAIGATFVGMVVAISKKIPDARLFGGIIVGLGVATMHYSGMAAFEVAGVVEWSRGLVAASVGIGVALSMGAMAVGSHKQSIRYTAAGAFLLALSIGSLHFTGMAAVELIPDSAIVVPEAAMSETWVAFGVTNAAFAVLLLAFVAMGVDIRDRRLSEREADHMRGLADAAVEGLLICDGDRIVSANSSLAALYGGTPSLLAGSSLLKLMPDADAEWTDQPKAGPVETTIVASDGTALPVEVIRHVINFAGKPHAALAVRDLRARKRAESRIHFLAHHDPLTGLPNRAAFNSCLDAEIDEHGANGRKLALLFLDLDRFKEVNDLFGHATGDALLQNFAQCVTAAIGDKPTMARLGGDEFAVICRDIGEREEAGRLAQTILDSLVESNRQSHAAVQISSSIGVAIFPDDGLDRAALLSHADTALYRAKADGRSAYRFFDPSMGEQLLERRRIEHDLRFALAGDELSLVYQPLTRIDTGETVGFEALLRWRHPERGNISPELFIPIAEETGLIHSIGKWVLLTACQEAAGWWQPLTIAVNVSALQLHDPGFVEIVHATLLQTGLASERLELEITETALIRDLARALTTLRQLKTLGVHISMDDFGTGYSSLANLRAFPFDKLKVDRSFVKAVHLNEKSGAMLRGILGLARGLGLPVVAEGVEEVGELQFLARESCSHAQGYLLSKPAPIESFAELTDASGETVLDKRRSGSIG